MTDNAITNSPPNDIQQDDSAAMLSFAEDVSIAVATGLLPFVGQAINIYDTVESLLALHNSTAKEADMEAKFDLVLALVGWIPGAGGGVKKAIRIVNKNPDRYAPVLFDVLRMVCSKLGITTSPEQLLDKLFDAAGLKSQLGVVQSAIEGSWAYEKMPSEAQLAISGAMMTVRTQLPAMVMLVTVKLTHWKTKQRNNAAHSFGQQNKANPTQNKPDKVDENIGQSGANAPSSSSSNNTLNSVIGTDVIEGISNSITGIVGEHITDYFLYEKYGWGKDWTSHDTGDQGSWKQKPSKSFPGKLNENTKLNQLFALKAHGTGIDGVWKVQLGDPHNGGKPYAIVESKASRVEDVPKNASAKPGMKSKLLDNAKRVKEAALPEVDDLLEPDTENDAVPPGAPTGGGRQGRQGRKTTPPSNNTSAEKKGASDNGKIYVQMSREWIEKNIRAAGVDRLVIDDFKMLAKKAYSRHLFYTPFYLPSAAQHLQALKDNEPKKHKKHKNHQIPTTHRHDEQEVKAAVNHKHAKLGLPLEL